MSTIRVSITQEQFEQYIRPALTVAKRCYAYSVPLYKVFNYILYRLHTGRQWDRLPIDPDPADLSHKRSAIMLSIQYRCEGFYLGNHGIVTGNHNDAYELKDNFRPAFKSIKRLGIGIIGSYFNADSAFDTKAARWTCFNHQVIPNIPEYKRFRKQTKRGSKRLFNTEV